MLIQNQIDQRLKDHLNIYDMTLENESHMHNNPPGKQHFIFLSEHLTKFFQNPKGQSMRAPATKYIPCFA